MYTHTSVTHSYTYVYECAVFFFLSDRRRGDFECQNFCYDAVDCNIIRVWWQKASERHWQTYLCLIFKAKRELLFTVKWEKCYFV